MSLWWIRAFAGWGDGVAEYGEGNGDGAGDGYMLRHHADGGGTGKDDHFVVLDP